MNNKNIHILILDDDVNIRLALNDILTEFGYKITGLGTIASAREELKKRFYNIILIDLKLPDGSGLEFLKEIRKLSEEIMVIVLTGFASLETAVSAMNEGAFTYLQKPLNIDELKVTVKKALKVQELSLNNKILLVRLRDKIKEVERLYKLKSKFTSMVSHEIKAPLAVIKESINLVLEGSTGNINQEQKEFLETAKRNMDRLVHFISEVLDLSKLTSKHIELKREGNKINDLINSVINNYKPEIDKKGLYIISKLEFTENLTINTDSDWVYQVLTNFISNAIRFTERGGITISTFKDVKANSVRVCVEDTGIGVRKENLSKLFRPFFQEKKRREGGTGLGLTICKDAIGYLGGKIWAESEFNKGSKFYFTLPLLERRKT